MPFTLYLRVNMNPVLPECRLLASVLCAMTACAACTDGSEPAPIATAAHALEGPASDATGSASAVLLDPSGNEVGRVSFSCADGDTTLVSVSAHLDVEDAGIRGMHIHANDDPSNGDGCIADPALDPSTWFVSVDGHFSPHSATHGHHAGDMPALFFTEAGDAAARFITDRFQCAAIRGRAVILHAGADNYGNIPVGDQPEQYTPNDPAATDLTARTGNAGARVACGVIE